jgi:hypothetical protein
MEGEFSFTILSFCYRNASSTFNTIKFIGFDWMLLDCYGQRVNLLVIKRPFVDNVAFNECY